MKGGLSFLRQELPTNVCDNDCLITVREVMIREMPNVGYRVSYSPNDR
jgi:hypothetical protein